MNFFDALKALTALVFVLGLILGLTWLLRRYGERIGIRTGLNPSDLKVVEWKSLDVRRKLAVVRWDGRDHLLCLGPTGDFKVADREAPAAGLAPGSQPGAQPGVVKAANDGDAT